MMCDGAGWHDERALTVPDNVTLALLPPYSPELNPVERVWLYLRERFLSLRVLDDTEAIIDACCQAWIDLIAEPDRMRTLCAYPWLRDILKATAAAHPDKRLRSQPPPGQDPPRGVWPVRGFEPAPARGGQAGDFRLSGPHALLHDDPERTLSAWSQTGCQTGQQDPGAHRRGASQALAPRHLGSW